MLLFASCHFKQSYPTLLYRNRSLSILQIQARQERLLHLSINREQRTQGAGFEPLPTHLYAVPTPHKCLSTSSPRANQAILQGHHVKMQQQQRQLREVPLSCISRVTFKGESRKVKLTMKKSKTKYHFSVKLYRKWSRLRVHTNQGSNQAT